MRSFNKKNRYIFYILTILCILGGFYFIRDYISLVALAFVVALLFNPVYKWFHHSLKKHKRLATPLTVTVILLSIIIPVSIIGYLSFRQVNNLISDVSKIVNTQNSSFDQILDRGVDKANRKFQTLPGNYQISKQKVNEFTGRVVPTVGNWVLNFAKGLGGSTAEFFTNLIIFIILLSSIFPNQDRIIRVVKKISPLDDEMDDIYLRRIKAMARSMVKGNFVIAAIQGILGGIFLAIAGVPYTSFFIILLTFLSIIPLGGGIISIPIGIGLLATGHYWQGALILATHFLVITNIDNILRPKLVSEDAKLPSVLTLIAVFAGIRMFGALGFIYGPIIMVFIFTTLQIYVRYYADDAKKMLGNTHDNELVEIQI